MLSSYYYHFESTGVPEIDRILSAVAHAGKAFHHTDGWNDAAGTLSGYTGTTPVEWIQGAANDAASKIKALTGKEGK